MWTSQVSDADFKRALEQSLSSAGLLSSQPSARFRLHANMQALRQPMVGVSMTVSARIHYTLIDSVSGQEVFAKTIDLPYTATMGDAFVGTERLRLANEGAIRANIRALVGELQQLDVNAVSM